MLGKSRRLSRIIVGEQQRCLLSPMDHGGWLGPVQGLHRPRAITEAVIKGGANALLISPGFYKRVAPIVPPSIGIVLRVSLTAGLSQEGFQETPIASLERAVRMDADAIVVSVFFGRSGDIEIYKWLATMVDNAEGYGMPVVAEMMPPFEGVDPYDSKAIAHAARIGMEIGADIIKTNYCGDVAAMREIVASVPVPIIVAGGPSEGDSDNTADLARDAIAGGAVGVAIGRRVWQSADPEKTTEGIYQALWA